MLVVVNVGENYSREHSRIHLKVLECLLLMKQKSQSAVYGETYMARGVDPSVVNGAHIFASLKIKLFEHGNFRLKALLFIIN